MAEKRNVTREGIRYRGRRYWHDNLLDHVGEQVQILSIDHNSICVYKGGKLICEAEVRKAVAFKPPTEVEDKGDKDVIFGLGKKLKDYKTDDLLKELATRKNTTLFKMHEGQQYQVKNGQQRVKEWGPAAVVVVRK